VRAGAEAVVEVGCRADGGVVSMGSDLSPIAWRALPAAGYLSRMVVADRGEPIVDPTFMGLTS
jgi:hypothetical protein